MEQAFIQFSYYSDFQHLNRLFIKQIIGCRNIFPLFILKITIIKINFNNFVAGRLKKAL